MDPNKLPSVQRHNSWNNMSPLPGIRSRNSERPQQYNNNCEPINNNSMQVFFEIKITQHNTRFCLTQKISIISWTLESLHHTQKLDLSSYRSGCCFCEMLGGKLRC